MDVKQSQSKTQLRMNNYIRIESVQINDELIGMGRQHKYISVRQRMEKLQLARSIRSHVMPDVALTYVCRKHLFSVRDGGF